MTSTPISLLQRLQQADNAEAWKRFVALYTPLLYYWARKLGLQGHDAADHVQDVFVLLVRKLGEFQPIAGKRFRSWLWTVFVNQFRTSRRRGSPPHSLEPTQLDQFAAPDELAAFDDDEYRRIFMSQALQLIKGNFQANTWKAFWDSTTKGKTAEQVGAELGMTAAAVRAAKFRVLSWLRREFEDFLE